MSTQQKTRLQKSWLRFIVPFAIAVMLLALLVAPAAASDFRGGDNVVIGSNEVIDDDLFISGNTVVMNGTVNGNLFVVGNQLEVNGLVNGSLFVGGQNVTVSGKVNGSLFGGASSLTLTSSAVVQRNLLFGGYQLKTERGSSIGRDLDVAGYQLLLNGDVARDARFAGEGLEVDGKVGRNLYADVGTPGAINAQPFGFTGFNTPPAIPVGIRVSQSASIGGQLTYVSPAQQDSAIESKPAGGIVYRLPPATSTQNPRVTPPPGASPFTFGEWRAADVVANGLREFATLLLLGLLAVLTLPRLVNSVAAKAEASPIAAVGWGLLVLIAGYALAIVALIVIVITGILLGAVSLGGLVFAVFAIGFSGLGLAVSGFTLLVAYGAEVVIAYLIGKLLLQQFAKSYSTNRALALLIGVTLYVLVTAIPFIGGLVSIIATLMGLGAMWYLIYHRGGTLLPVAGAKPA